MRLAPSRWFGATFASLEVPYFLPVWASGWFWALTRWFTAFLSSYLVTQLTGSPLLVQLTGAAFFVANLTAGGLFGTLADRFDARRVCLAGYLAMLPIAVAMYLAVASGRVQVWMVYPFMVAMGIGQVMSISVRVVMIHDLVGDERMTNALVLEYLSLNAGNIVGPLIAGAAIGVAGMGQAFALPILAITGSLLTLSRYPAGARAERRRPKPVASGPAESVGAVRLLRHNRALFSILGVTALMNLFFFPYIPLVPVFAQRLGVGPVLTGLLASAAGIGTIAGTLTIASFSRSRRGLLYCGGSVVALASLFLFAASPWYVLGFFALMLAGAGVSGFGSMQSTLVVLSVPSQQRGRALGLTSVAIGSMPFGLFGLGVLAEFAGAPAGLMLSAGGGLVLLLGFLLRRPESRSIR